MGSEAQGSMKAKGLKTKSSASLMAEIRLRVSSSSRKKQRSCGQRVVWVMMILANNLNLQSGNPGPG